MSFDGVRPDGVRPVCDGTGKRPAAPDLRRFLAGMTTMFGLVVAAGAMLLAQG